MLALLKSIVPKVMIGVIAIVGSVTISYSQAYRHPDGSTSKINGNQMYHSDGSVSRRVGTTWFHPNGTNSRLIGNTYFHSDGGTSRESEGPWRSAASPRTSFKSNNADSGAFNTLVNSLNSAEQNRIARERIAVDRERIEFDRRKSKAELDAQIHQQALRSAQARRELEAQERIARQQMAAERMRNRKQ